MDGYKCDNTELYSTEMHGSPTHIVATLSLHSTTLIETIYSEPLEAKIGMGRDACALLTFTSERSFIFFNYSQLSSEKTLAVISSDPLKISLPSFDTAMSVIESE